MVVATSVFDNQSVTLINGVPQAGRLDTLSEVDFYRFSVYTGHKDVYFTVNARFGDPDIYIRNDGQRPYPGFSQWSGRAFGRDEVVVCCLFVFFLLFFPRHLFEKYFFFPVFFFVFCFCFACADSILSV